MVDTLRPVDEAKWNVAKSQVQDWLIAMRADFEPLSAEQVSAYGVPSLIGGWRLRIPHEKLTILELDFLLPIDFPWAKPRTALANGPQYRTWPHIEKNGLMCLFSSSSTSIVDEPVTLAKATLLESIALIDRVTSQDNSSDFESEFHSYWPEDLSALNVKSLTDLSGENRMISFIIKKGLCLVADNDDFIRAWLTNSTGINLEKISGINKGVLIHLDKPLVPSQYPQTLNELLSLLKDDVSFIHQAIVTLPRAIPVILAAPTNTGMTVCAVFIESNFRTEGSKSIFRGFRNIAMPDTLLFDRYLRSSKIKLTKVERVDANWVHGRDNNHSLNDLQNLSVGIIGCGSLGGFVAYGLAQAGVGTLHLIDPEKFYLTLIPADIF